MAETEIIIPLQEHREVEFKLIKLCKATFKLGQAISDGIREACSVNNGQIENSRDEVMKSIKATRKLPDGIYIKGSVQGYPILFTADTGASKTIISRRTYEAMKSVDRPSLGK